MRNTAAALNCSELHAKRFGLGALRPPMLPQEFWRVVLRLSSQAHADRSVGHPRPIKGTCPQGTLPGTLPGDASGGRAPRTPLRMRPPGASPWMRVPRDVPRTGPPNAPPGRAPRMRRLPDTGPVLPWKGPEKALEAWKAAKTNPGDVRGGVRGTRRMSGGRVPRTPPRMRPPGASPRMRVPRDVPRTRPQDASTPGHGHCASLGRP